MILLFVILSVLQLFSQTLCRATHSKLDSRETPDQLRHFLQPLFNAKIPDDKIKVQVLPYKDYKSHKVRKLKTTSPSRKQKPDVPLAIILADSQIKNENKRRGTPIHIKTFNKGDLKHTFHSNSESQEDQKPFIIQVDRSSYINKKIAKTKDDKSGHTPRDRTLKAERDTDKRHSSRYRHTSSESENLSSSESSIPFEDLTTEYEKWGKVKNEYSSESQGSHSTEIEGHYKNIQHTHSKRNSGYQKNHPYNSKYKIKKHSVENSQSVTELSSESASTEEEGGKINYNAHKAATFEDNHSHEIKNHREKENYSFRDSKGHSSSEASKEHSTMHDSQENHRKHYNKYNQVKHSKPGENRNNRHQAKHQSEEENRNGNEKYHGFHERNERHNKHGIIEQHGKHDDSKHHKKAVNNEKHKNHESSEHKIHVNNKHDGRINNGLHDGIKYYEIHASEEKGGSGEYHKNHIGKGYHQKGQSDEDNKIRENKEHHQNHGSKEHHKKYRIDEKHDENGVTDYPEKHAYKEHNRQHKSIHHGKHDDNKNHRNERSGERHEKYTNEDHRGFQDSIEYHDEHESKEDHGKRNNKDHRIDKIKDSPGIDESKESYDKYGPKEHHEVKGGIEHDDIHVGMEPHGIHSRKEPSGVHEVEEHPHKFGSEGKYKTDGSIEYRDMHTNKEHHWVPDSKVKHVKNGSEEEREHHDSKENQVNDGTYENKENRDNINHDEKHRSKEDHGVHDSYNYHEINKSENNSKTQETYEKNHESKEGKDTQNSKEHSGKSESQQEQENIYKASSAEYHKKLDGQQNHNYNENKVHNGEVKQVHEQIHQNKEHNAIHGSIEHHGKPTGQEEHDVGEHHSKYGSEVDEKRDDHTHHGSAENHGSERDTKREEKQIKVDEEYHSDDEGDEDNYKIKIAHHEEEPPQAQKNSQVNTSNKGQEHSISELEVSVEPILTQNTENINFTNLHSLLPRNVIKGDSLESIKHKNSQENRERSTEEISNDNSQLTKSHEKLYKESQSLESTANSSSDKYHVDQETDHRVLIKTHDSVSGESMEDHIDLKEKDIPIMFEGDIHKLVNDAIKSESEKIKNSDTSHVVVNEDIPIIEVDKSLHSGDHNVIIDDELVNTIYSKEHVVANHFIPNHNQRNHDSDNFGENENISLKSHTFTPEDSMENFDKDNELDSDEIIEIVILSDEINSKPISEEQTQTDQHINKEIGHHVSNSYERMEVDDNSASPNVHHTEKSVSANSVEIVNATDKEIIIGNRGSYEDILKVGYSKNGHILKTSKEDRHDPHKNKNHGLHHNRGEKYNIDTKKIEAEHHRTERNHVVSDEKTSKEKSNDQDKYKHDSEKDKETGKHKKLKNGSDHEVHDVAEYSGETSEELKSVEKLVLDTITQYVRNREHSSAEKVASKSYNLSFLFNRR